MRRGLPPRFKETCEASDIESAQRVPIDRATTNLGGRPRTPTSVGSRPVAERARELGGPGQTTAQRGAPGLRIEGTDLTWHDGYRAAEDDGGPRARRRKVRGIVLVGFMGSGKTTVGRRLARELDLRFLDADKKLEERSGRSISDWFVESEAAFREAEERLALELLQERDAVVALGGGGLQSPMVRNAVRDHLVVFCDVDLETAWRRCSSGKRPLARDRAVFARLFEARRPAYDGVADVFLVNPDLSAIPSLAPWIERLMTGVPVRLAWATSKSASYPAVVGRDALRLLPADYRFLVADTNALAYHGAKLPSALATRRYECDVSESLKTFKGAEKLLEWLVDEDAAPDDGLVAFGGGVVGDLAGFCAALWHRDGMRILQAPTTLLSQVDSAYGGKTGVNLRNAKHKVGAYHMPQAVIADTTVLQTLPDREVRSGFVEVIKTALIAGGPLWNRVRSVSSLDVAEMDGIIFDCVRTKLAVVEQDERDRGQRMWLNLGHTLGHAFEVVTGYSRYTHGEAVGLGLLAALRLSQLSELHDEVESLLNNHHLPTRLDDDVDLDAVIEAKRTDKKKGFVLVESPGQLRSDVPVSDHDVRRVLVDLCRPGRPARYVSTEAL